MTSIAQGHNSGGIKTPVLPNLSCISPGDTAMAACVYADAGLYVLPVASGKHPGSIVGSNWPTKSSRDGATVCEWWLNHPDAGIAIHTGASGIMAFDLDIDVMPDELAWLKEGAFQSTRRGAGARGHYVFYTGTELFVSGDIELTDGTKVGEIRSGNTVIMAEPSPHAKAGDGGGYVWATDDVGQPFQILPDEARPYLRPLGTARAGGRVTATDETVTEALSEWNNSDRPTALRGLVESVRTARSGTRNQTRNVLRIAAGESRIGFYPLTEAVTKIRSAAIDSYTERGESFDVRIGEHEFSRLVANGVGDALSRSIKDIAMQANRNYGTHHEDSGTGLQEPKRFGGVTAVELAAPIAPMHWLIRGVWPKRSAGVLAGEKKTFKTWNLQAMALAVAAGLPMFDQFEVTAAQPVLYLCGEGGRDAFANRHQVIGKRYGLTTDDLRSLPFVAEFDTAEIGSTDLRDGIMAHLDRLQPELVILDPLYAYHPHDIEASNLYARGPILAKLRDMIEGHAALVVGDHFKKNTDALDLDNISMAGMGQWADTWALQRHRSDPDLATNDFHLDVEFSTRRGGGRRWEIDWHLDRDSDPDVVAWAACDWTVIAPSNSGTTTPQRDYDLKIVREVMNNPWSLNRTTLHTRIGGRKQSVLQAVTRLLDALELSERQPPKGQGTAMLLGPGKVITGQVPNTP